MSPSTRQGRRILCRGKSWPVTDLGSRGGTSNIASNINKWSGRNSAKAKRAGESPLADLDEKIAARAANQPRIAPWAHFNGPAGTFELLDENENVVGAGQAGSAGALETSIVRLDLAKSSFQGSGPNGAERHSEFRGQLQGGGGRKGCRASVSEPTAGK